jgi:urease accessory protein
LLVFAVAGYAHGYALAETIVGAEVTPLAAYFAGLMIVQIGLALGAYNLARWYARHRPALPLVRAAGAAAAIAGVTVIALALA